MAALPPSIALLPENVRLKISSSHQITSHEHVIEGLVQNALDAGANSISVEVDFAKGYFNIRDDGVGIESVDFTGAGQLGRPHCTDAPLIPAASTPLMLHLGTSKSNPPSPTFGRYGRFLSCLSYLSLLSITSQRRSESRVNRLILHRGKVVSRCLDLTVEDAGVIGQGTTVVVHDLFGNVPVRSRHLFRHFSSPAGLGKAFDHTKRRLVGYLLARSGAFDLRFCLAHGRRQYIHSRSRATNDGQMTIDSTVSTLFQAGLLASPDPTSWRLASIRSSEFTISAVISLEPCACRDIQYISIGQFPVTNDTANNDLFEAVNNVFQRSRFGAVVRDQVLRPQVPGIGNGSAQSREVVGNSKGTDRWPMFYIRVDMISEKLCAPMILDDAPAELRPAVGRLIKALEALVSCFLKSHGFQLSSKELDPSWSHRVYTNELQAKGFWLRSASWRPQVGSQAQQLNNWHRVKSGLHSSGRDARCVRDIVRYCEPQMPPTPTWRSQLSVDGLRDGRRYVDSLHNCAGSFSNDNETSRHRDVRGDELDEAFILPWTNPRNGRVVRLHPRTGAVVPYSGNRASSPTGAVQSHIPLKQHPHAADRLKPARPGACGGAGLELPSQLAKYTKSASLPQVESSIQSLNSAMCSIPVKGKPNWSKSSIICHDSSGQVDKESLARSTIVQQVDQKFVLAILPASCDEAENQKQHLILVDQHAADERIKLESLCREICERKRRILDQPVVFAVDFAEAKLFEQRREYLEKWCFSYTVAWSGLSPQSLSRGNKEQSGTIYVTALPKPVAERLLAEPTALVDLLRNEVWSTNSASACSPCGRVDHGSARKETQWVVEIATCPMGVLEMLKSRSCRAAIMFNDRLDLAECRRLVHRLAKCVFPFQCAHGRPTLTVLGTLDGHEHYAESNDSGFGARWNSWTASE